MEAKLLEVSGDCLLMINLKRCVCGGGGGGRGGGSTTTMKYDSGIIFL